MKNTGNILKFLEIGGLVSHEKKRNSLRTMDIDYEQKRVTIRILTMENIV